MRVLAKTRGFLSSPIAAASCPKPRGGRARPCPSAGGSGRAEAPALLVPPFPQPSSSGQGWINLSEPSQEPRPCRAAPWPGAELGATALGQRRAASAWAAEPRDARGVRGASASVPCVLWNRGQGRPWARGTWVPSRASPLCSPLNLPRSSPRSHRERRAPRRCCSSCSSPLSPCAVSPARILRHPSAPPEPPLTPTRVGTDGVPLSPGHCSELDVGAVERVVGGTEARSHAWPYQVRPAGFPEPLPGLSWRREPALSPGRVSPPLPRSPSSITPTAAGTTPAGAPSSRGTG